MQDRPVDALAYGGEMACREMEDEEERSWSQAKFRSLISYKVLLGLIGGLWRLILCHRRLLLDNGIKKVKLFDADENTMKVLAGSNIEVMVAIPNNMLAIMNDYDAAKHWVDRNVSRYMFEGGVNIKFDILILVDHWDELFVV